MTFFKRRHTRQNPIDIRRVNGVLQFATGITTTRGPCSVTPTVLDQFSCAVRNAAASPPAIACDLRTAAHLAARAGQLHVIKWLGENGFEDLLSKVRASAAVVFGW